MRTFVNVHTGVASGTSLIYMYDASKQNTKKNRCLELTASNKQTVLPLSRIVPCVIRQISVMVSLSSGKLIKVLKTTRQDLIRI